MSPKSLIFFLLLVPVLLGGMYGIIVAYMYVAQDRLLYQPNWAGRMHTKTPDSVGLDYEIIDIVTSDDIVLDGWFIPSPQDHGVILFFHGNAGNISDRLASLQIFNRLGFSTLIIDYRGYGRSQGKPSESGTYYDAEAAWQYLTEKRQIDPQKIVLFGRSLGGAVAAHLAGRHKPAALILESTFSSIPNLAADLYPLLPVRRLSRFHYDTGKSLKTVSCPVLIIHSIDDDIIPFSHGRKLFSDANEPKQFRTVRGSHNEGFLLSGSNYINGLKDFLAEHYPYREEDSVQ